MRKFFSITEDKYIFNIFDVTALITVLNVALILMGYWWAPILGLINNAIVIFINVKTKAYINSYITQIALIILNCYFLTL